MLTPMTYLYYILGALVLALALFVLGQYVYVNYKLEKPVYSVVSTTEKYEIREYEPYLTASAQVTDNGDAMNNGFRLVADYIFGNNTKSGGGAEPIAMTAPVIDEIVISEPIAMTAPVIDQLSSQGMRTVSFVLPASYTLETLPQPNNDQVVITAVPAHTWAVYTYSGANPRTKKIKKYQEFLDILSKEGIEHTGEWQSASYDPPSTPLFLRTHEIWIKIK